MFWITCDCTGEITSVLETVVAMAYLGFNDENLIMANLA